MDVAALITWVITALGGFYLLGTWLSARARRPAAATVGAGAPGRGAAGGAAGGGQPSRLPAPIVFGHFLLAAAGLVLWIVYLASDKSALAWVSFVLLVIVALGGFTLFGRWISGRSAARPGGGAPEDRFPVPVVAAHGVLAATTLILVLIAALQSGS